MQHPKGKKPTPKCNHTQSWEAKKYQWMNKKQEHTQTKMQTAHQNESKKYIKP